MPIGSPPSSTGETQNVSFSPVNSDVKYQSFLALTSEGIWHVVAGEPIPTNLPVDEQVRRMFSTGRFVDCNDAFAQMYNRSGPRQMLGVPLRDLLPESDPQSHQFLSSFVRSGYRLAAHETNDSMVLGATRTFLNSLVGVVRDGHLLEAWGSQTDITERKRLEQQARQAQAMDAVSRLSGSVAHDFNNLLTTILTSVEMLIEQFHPADPARDDAEAIRRAARHGAELTRQLLALSRQQMLAPRAVDLQGLVRRIEDNIRSAFASSAAVDVTLGEEPGIAHVDIEEMEQMLLHLASHAAGVIGDRGTFSLDVRRETLAESRAALPDVVGAGEYVTIRFKHSGVLASGLAEPSLLEPFAGQEMPSLGSGLALATMYGFVRQSGGAVVLEPVDVGVALSLYFPATTLPTPAVPGTARHQQSGQQTILLAEDEPTVRLLMKRVLERAGFAVLVAGSGEEALEVAHAYGSDIHLLVTDVIMPGMGGGELSRRLRHERPDMRVLHVSGYTAGALRLHEAIEDGATFLQKPFAPSTLLAKLTEILV